MSIDLIRAALKEPYQTAKNAHPGLLVQKGYPFHDEQDKEARTKHIQRICAIPADPFYANAYQRWQAYTSDPKRFAALVLKIETRLLIGLSGGGMLETGCAIHHSYGVPYIPGSSIKGIVNNFVRHRSDFGQQQKAACDLLFGAAADPDSDNPDGLAGLFSFHDAWWVPNSAKTPLVQDVVTTHHPDYYGHNGETAATDFDSPVPNAQIGVQGSFHFTLEGPEPWLELGMEMLKEALEHQGIGAKTRSGYGLFAEDQKARREREALIQEQKELEDKIKEEEALAKLTPLQRELHEFMEKHKDNPATELYNALKAGKWDEQESRREVAAKIKSLWEEAGSWNPDFEGTNKKKVQQKERCQLVRQWLES